MAFEDASKGVGHRNGTEYTGLGLHAEVTQGKFDLLRYFTWPTQGTFAVCTGGNGKIFVGDTFQFVIGRMKHYPINALSAFIILDQHGSLAVSDLCKFVHPLRRDLAHPAENPLCPFKILC